MYQGTRIPMPLAADGLYGTRKIPMAGLRVARGVTLETAGQIEKEGGAVKLTASALPSRIVALYDWWPDAATQRTIAVTSGGGVYRDDGAAWSFATTIYAEGTLTISQPPHLVAAAGETPAAARKLFLVTGNNTVRIGTGDFTTMAELAVGKTPADWAGATQPPCLAAHAGRLWAFLRHTAYYSKLTDHEDFAGAGSGSLPLQPGEGDRIVAAVSFRKMLVVFKYPTGIYVIDASAPSPANWGTDLQTRAVGSCGPWTALSLTDDVLFLSAELNVHLLSATNVLRDATASDISTPKLGPWARATVNPARAAWAHLG